MLNISELISSAYEKNIQGSEIKLQTAKDEVMRKIGRNLLNFQQLEKILKFLVINGETSGYFSNIKQNQQKRSKNVGKQTLGMVARQFFEQNFSDEENDEHMPIEVQEPYFKTTFQLDTENPNPEGKAEKLSRLVAARNDLVHHFLDRIDMKSKKSLLDASDYLDKQRESIILEFDYYRNLVKSLHEVRKSFAEFLMSDESTDLLMGQLNVNDDPKKN